MIYSTYNLLITVYYFLKEIHGLFKKNHNQELVYKKQIS